MRKEYILRLDDASDFRDKEKWDRVEVLCDKYGIHPLVGLIPQNEDEELTKYRNNNDIWDKAKNWQKKGWIIAVHGYTHRFEDTKNHVAEFGQASFNDASKRIKRSVDIFKAHDFSANIFFAPAHQYSSGTVAALIECEDIKIISDGYATLPYIKRGITYVPAQTGMVKRSLPYRMVTFVYHPNEMKKCDFDNLETFLRIERERFIDFPISQTKRRKSPYDYVVEILLKTSRLIRTRRNSE